MRFMNNVTFIILEAICCPKWESFVNEIASNGSDVAIVSIICLTIFVSLLTTSCKTFSYMKERLSSEADKKNIEELNQQIVELKKETQNLKEKLAKASEVKPCKSDEEKTKELLKEIVSMSKDKDGVTNVETVKILLEQYNATLTGYRGHSDNK